MTGFDEFLRERLDRGGFSTEDALASFLPLVREVVETHAAGKVAPLEGVADLRVEGNRIWFEQARRQEPRKNAAALGRVAAANRAGVEIIAESRRTTDVDDGRLQEANLAIGNLEDEIRQPVYLPGYVSWEHRQGHHDPLTDVFTLGLILASLACGVDLHEPSDLQRFVAARGNLFQLAPQLHPVLAQAIVRMTEVDRHRRAPDLPALLGSLENYRDQEVDFDIELARVAGFREQDSQAKQHVVLTKLKERLFEISRRNRLLHFRPTMQTVNLTQASVPLSYDIKNIRPDQILVWNETLRKTLAAGKSISLNKYLNFSEALYLPGVLDRIMADARRDQSEFGFAQLRLVACFLHWANLKEKPVEQYESPLVLIPVRLKKKKGIRDTYTIEPLASEAEINPVVRHQFKHLYDIDLPETIDLATTSLDEFHRYLEGQIHASDPSITLQKIDRPRIALIHDKARRKLDQYRRRARIAGRGVRRFLDLDYSYDPANFHPLGIKLFSAKVRPAGTHLREIIEEKPRPRSFAAPDADPPVVEKERSFFSLQEGGGDNPYVWSVDFCAITLANFKYRRMSLVRDYDALLGGPPPNEAFDATFSLAPRPVDRDLREPPPLEDRYDVVPCDPTQATAVAEARSGSSYIIQGPPGTGKSQTITNLIADYVAQGKRVLFVCEKRAAIDVVYSRLKQCGLADLCSLIHDSQTDKKAFVMNLKQTYETFLAEAETQSAGGRRSKLLQRIAGDLAPLAHFDQAMHTTPKHAGVPVRHLVSRCIELAAARPELSPLERERLPDYAHWNRARDQIAQYEETVRAFQPDTILANHPLHAIAPRIVHAERPMERVLESIQDAQQHLAAAEQALAGSAVPRSAWDRIADARRLVAYARRVQPFARRGQFALLDPDSERAREFGEMVRSVRQQQQQLVDARKITHPWRAKIPREEVPAALAQAQAFEAATCPWLKPAWWRLRSVLNQAYDFKSHMVQPSWSQVLSRLQDEYACADELHRLQRNIAEQFQLDGEVDDAVSLITELRTALADASDEIPRVHSALLESDNPRQTVELLAEVEAHLTQLDAALEPVWDGPAQPTFAELQTQLGEAAASAACLPDYVQCLSELDGVADEVSAVLRRMPLSPAELEAALAEASLEQVYRADRALDRFDGAARNRHASRLEAAYQAWLATNATEIRDRVRRRFLEHMHVAGLPAAQLDEDQKAFKKRYNRGRRELEHEFGKSMRYKSIRDLVADESGDVVRDLKPVWLMSPLSVSDTLPLDTEHFDVVIFDEASQITLEESVPSIFRAGQAIVVGDEMQLPPTDFFSARRSAEEEELLVEEQGELVQYDLDSNSFLNHAAKNLSSTMLGWHYRSRSESLISFSNWAFYEGRLLTVPEENLPAPDRPPLVAAAAADARAHTGELLARSVSFHQMEHGVYERRRNRAEAEYIAELVRELLEREDGTSLGIVAFSEAQQDEIETALERLAQDDKAFRKRLDRELEREEDGQFVGLLVKNLENIQGDERDVIILSVCYAPNAQGKMRMNFGPINKSGGEKRLNVAFSRAKHHMALVSSIRHEAITNDYNDGANCLKNYLAYAEAISVGDQATAGRILRGTSPWQATRHDEASAAPAVSQIAAALIEHGYDVDRAVGQSHFRCDLAVRSAGDTTYRLGILVDGDDYYHQKDLLERDMMRPRLLRNFGWKIEHVLAKDWHAARASVLERLVQRLADDPPEEPEDSALLDADLADDDLSGDESATNGPEAGDNGAAPELALASRDDAITSEATSAPSAEESAASATRYFELVDGASRKFWEITQDDRQHTVRFGRIGTSGQTRTKEFSDRESAARDAQRLVREKLRKGYQEK